MQPYLLSIKFLNQPGNHRRDDTTKYPALVYIRSANVVKNVIYFTLPLDVDSLKIISHTTDQKPSYLQSTTLVTVRNIMNIKKIVTKLDHSSIIKVDMHRF